MRVKVALTAWVIALGALGFLLGGTVASGAPAHGSGCHGAHTCPSDHHMYVWTDLTTGLQWDCVEPGAPEFDPFEDQTFISYEGRTYICRAAGQSNVTTLSGTTTATDVTTATEPTTTTQATTQSTLVTQTAATTTTSTTAGPG